MEWFDSTRKPKEVKQFQVRMSVYGRPDVCTTLLWDGHHWMDKDWEGIFRSPSTFGLGSNDKWLGKNGDAKPIDPPRQSFQEMYRESYKAAALLAQHMQEEFYPEVTAFQAQPDLEGVISQIDNMLTGLRRYQPEPCAITPAARNDRQVELLKLAVRDETKDEV